MAVFRGGESRDDEFVGGTAADTFYFDPAELTGGDRIVGGDGARADTLVFTAAGAIGPSALANISGIERIELAAGANSLVLTDAFVASATGGRVAIVAQDGDDAIDATRLGDASAIDVTTGAGIDTVRGGTGADIVRVRADALTQDDLLAGGLGIDRLELIGGGTMSDLMLLGVSGFEIIALGSEGIDLTLHGGFTGPLQILGGDGADRIDTSWVPDLPGVATLWVQGGAGDDELIGASGAIAAYFDGGAGADRITVGRARVVYDAGDGEVRSTGGQLVVNGAAVIDLTAADQSVGDAAVVSGFRSVDARGADAGVWVTGTMGDVVYGSRYADTLTGGSVLIGGGGRDTMIGGPGSTTFVVGTGDFVRGETIRGVINPAGTTFNRLAVTGSADLRGGTVSGITAIEFRAGGEASAMLSLKASQFVSVQQVLGLADIVGDPIPALTVNVTMERGVALAQPGFVSGVRLVATGSAGADTIVGAAFSEAHGGKGDDVIQIGSAVFPVQITGDAGDDRITGGLRTQGSVIDGGSGSDTFVRMFDGYEPVSIDLSRIDNQNLSGGTVLRGFENVDLRSVEYTTVTVAGSSAVNHIIGSNGADTISGGGGDDVIEGGLGRDTLSGGSGADTFAFSAAPSPRYYNGALATITDYRPGEDRLAFDADLYGFTTRSFDTRVVTDGTTPLGTADLIIYTGGRIESADGVALILQELGGRADKPVFVVGLDGDGDTVIYWADSMQPGTWDGSVAPIAELARTGDPAAITLSDFAFI